MELLEKFNAKLPHTLNETECWEWSGTIDAYGYGVLSHNNKTLKSHRISYEIFYAEPLKDLHCLHKCDNRKCVNPLHLFSGTNLDKDQNFTTRKLGKLFNVNRSTISYIISNKTYTHLLEN